MALDDMTSVIAAVVALADDALVAFDLFPEGVLAASENETHGDELVVRWNRESVV
jgi:hypothetical protein